jgi:hypothetical protein
MTSCDAQHFRFRRLLLTRFRKFAFEPRDLGRLSASG